jgi:hypothetical protein
MRPRTPVPLVAAALILLTAAPALRAAPPDKTPNGYDRQVVEGFTVYVHHEVMHHRHDGFGRPPLTALENELNDLRRLLHPKIVAILQTIPIWAEWDDHGIPGAVAVYYSGKAKDLQDNGRDPRMAGNVQVLTLKTLALMRKPGTPLQQVILLHEMAHAVQDRLLGMDNPELKAIYRQAMDRKLYDEVNDKFGQRGPAYARTNPAEYFAEISCAYLDSCNYFPFNHEQLRGHDPVGFKFVERVWKEPERFAVIANKRREGSGGPVAAAAEATTEPPPRAGVAAERDAMLKLDRLRGLLAKGKKAEAKKGLEELIRTFPTTDAADEAKDLLKEIK